MYSGCSTCPPNVNQSLLEYIDIVGLHLLHTLRHHPPNFVISVVQVVGP